MVVRGGSASFEITLREVGPTGTPGEGDPGVAVAFAGAAFAGRNDAVWIGRHEWAGFLEDLGVLERTRRGEAHVTAMSPEEFRLALFASDRAGHLAAEGRVAREYAGRHGALRDRASFSFALDPATLPTLVRQFGAFAPAG